MECVWDDYSACITPGAGLGQQGTLATVSTGALCPVFTPYGQDQAHNCLVTTYNMTNTPPPVLLLGMGNWKVENISCLYWLCTPCMPLYTYTGTQEENVLIVHSTIRVKYECTILLGGEMLIENLHVRYSIYH